VRKAEADVLPLAVASARARAVRIGQAAGLNVGAVVAVVDGFSPYFGSFGPFGSSGTFGPGKFCGTVGRFRFVRRDGRIVGRKRIGSRRTCRIPARVGSTLSVTYATSPAQPAA